MDRRFTQKEPVQRAIDQHDCGKREQAARLRLILWLEIWTRLVMECPMDRPASLLEGLSSK